MQRTSQQYTSHEAAGRQAPLQRRHHQLGLRMGHGGRVRVDLRVPDARRAHVLLRELVAHGLQHHTVGHILGQLMRFLRASRRPRHAT